jgi:regulation of enolase protein 1 (concanavalin A-like superfamily)
MTRRNLIRVALLLSLIGLGASAGEDAKPAASGAKADPQPEPPFPYWFEATETFDGKLRLNWKPVRHDPTHASLTKNKGRLTITTQRGSIHEDEVARGDPKAKNLFLIDNPLAADADFEVTTSFSGFTPREAYQQAGLILYNDDDNYLKWSYEYDWTRGGGQRFCLVRETNAKAEHSPAEVPAGLKKVWLRLTKRKDQYEYASSKDGKTFTVHGTRPWDKKAPAKIGILAKNGGPAGVTEVDVLFELFRLRAPAPPATKKKQ